MNHVSLFLELSVLLPDHFARSIFCCHGSPSSAKHRRIVRDISMYKQTFSACLTLPSYFNVKAFAAITRVQASLVPRMYISLFANSVIIVNHVALLYHTREVSFYTQTYLLESKYYINVKKKLRIENCFSCRVSLS